VLLPKNRVKLLLNLLLLAGQTIPRGGTLTIVPLGEGEVTGFQLTATGLNARIPQAVPGLLSGVPASDGVDAHAIQPLFAGMLARACGLELGLAGDAGGVVLTARPNGSS
jgi:histidine phosphotransferase ChpT